MNWMDEVKIKIKNRNQILFSKDSKFLKELDILLKEQSHRVLVLWALELADEALKNLQEKYPDEKSAEEAITAARAWAFGDIKMNLAKRKILDCHALAKSLQDKADIAVCHAIAQACSVVHTAKHAMGFPIYELSSIVYQYGIDESYEKVEKRKQEYIDKIYYWNKNIDKYKGKWANFILK